MHAPLADCRGRLSPAAITLQELQASPVTACLGTIFTEAVPDPAAADAEAGAFAYPAGDALAARAAGLRQHKLYQAWDQAGVIRLIEPGKPLSADGPLAVGLLMESADPIESPEHVDEFPGLMVVGLTWATGSRYAAGNAEAVKGNRGLTDLGRALVRELDARSIIHDASHLSDRALDDLFACTDSMVVASHSNCRAVSSWGDATRDQRQLTDEAIAEIGRRGGLVGLNLFTGFVDVGVSEQGKRASIARAVDHVEHVAQVMGHRRGVALGSDIDGGFAADRLVEGIDRPGDLAKLADELTLRGWSDEEVCGFAFGNWARVLGLG